jgi:hypothetical protein
MKWLVSAQQRLYRFGQEHRGNGIDRKLFHELATFHLFETFFWLQVRTMQTPAAVDHQSKRFVPRREVLTETIQVIV